MQQVIYTNGKVVCMRSKTIHSLCEKAKQVTEGREKGREGGGAWAARQRFRAENDTHSSKQCLDKMTKYHGKK